MTADGRFFKTYQNELSHSCNVIAFWFCKFVIPDCSSYVKIVIYVTSCEMGIRCVRCEILKLRFTTRFCQGCFSCTKLMPFQINANCGCSWPKWVQEKCWQGSLTSSIMNDMNWNKEGWIVLSFLSMLKHQYPFNPFFFDCSDHEIFIYFNHWVQQISRFGGFTNIFRMFWDPVKFVRVEIVVSSFHRKYTMRMQRCVDKLATFVQQSYMKTFCNLFPESLIYYTIN